MLALSGVLGGSALAMAPGPDSPPESAQQAAPEAAPAPEVQPPVVTEEVPVPEAGLQEAETPTAGAEDETLHVPPVADELEPDVRELADTGEERGKQDGKGKKRGTKDKQHKKSRGEHRGDGPPPWAPAHGYRCKAAGKAPGTPAFKRCIKSRKSGR